MKLYICSLFPFRVAYLTWPHFPGADRFSAQRRNLPVLFDSFPVLKEKGRLLGDLYEKKNDVPPSAWFFTSLPFRGTQHHSSQ